MKTTMETMAGVTGVRFHNDYGTGLEVKLEQWEGQSHSLLQKLPWQLLLAAEHYWSSKLWKLFSSQIWQNTWL